MKRRLLYLLTIPLLLASCSIKEETSQNTSSSEETSSQESESSSESIEEIHIPTKMVGRWYISSSNMGEIPVNGIFDINEDDTLEIGERTLSLKGNYAGYTDSYEFVYGTIHFIVSYDEEDNGINWAYQNGETYDFGFAKDEPTTSNTYEYEGAEYPMDMINEYLGTEGNVPAFEASYYYLDLFTSSMYDAKCANVEIDGTTKESTASYISSLVEAGYTFSNFENSVTASTFYYGYDANKIYSLRVIFYEEDTEEECETDIFIYKYNEKIKAATL